MIITAADTAKHDRRSLVRELRESDGYKEVLEPEIRRRLEIHSVAVKSRDKTPEQRAEHIEAVHLCEELLGFLAAEEGRLDRDIKHERLK